MRCKRITENCPLFVVFVPRLIPCFVSFVVSSTQQLTLMYLCNDVIQNSKRKGPEYTQEFEKILPKAIKVVHKCVL